MTIGSLCLTEILKSWKSCSSKRLASHTALSTSASGVALPYFSSRRGSREPAFTPMRIETSAAFARLRDLGDLVVELADVAGVHAHRRAARVDRGVDVVRLEVDVGDDRDLALLRDDRQRLGVVAAGHGDADDVAARRGELGDLLEGRVDVRRGRRGHRLHAHLGVAADEDLAHLDLAGLASRGQDLRDFGHSEIHCRHVTSLLPAGWARPPSSGCAVAHSLTRSRRPPARVRRSTSPSPRRRWVRRSR